MANTLQDVIRKRLSQTPNQGELGALPGQTQQIQGILGAKEGKAATANTGPGASNIQEQAALTQGQQQMKQIGNEGQVKAQQQDIQQDEQKQAFNIQEQDLGNRRQQFLNDSQQKLSGIYQQAQQAEKELNFDKQKAAVEQAGFYERMKNEKYVNQLQQEGEKARLNSDIGFKTSLMNNAMGNAVATLGDKLSYQTLFNASDRKFKEQLAAMDINQAAAILAANINQANQQAIFNGVDKMVEGGAKYYASNSSSDTSSGKK